MVKLPLKKGEFGQQVWAKTKLYVMKEAQNSTQHHTSDKTSQFELQRLYTFHSLFHYFAIKGTEKSEGLRCLNCNRTTVTRQIQVKTTSFIFLP